MKQTKLIQRFAIPAFIILFGLTACSQNTNTDGKDGASSKGKGSSTSTGTINGGNSSNVDTSESNFNYGNSNSANDKSDLTLAGLKDPNNLLSQRVIYFDYNQSAIRTEYMVLINTHAQLAAKFPHLKMRLEGHADERGSREYNVALSEARAQSVKRLMGVQGARSNQIRTIGYGEEVPVVAGQGERSWQKNRRVEIKYDNE